MVSLADKLQLIPLGAELDRPPPQAAIRTPPADLQQAMDGGGALVFTPLRGNPEANATSS